MNNYEEYFLMKAGDLEEYIENKLHYFKEGNKIVSEEIGDGNLNYVFRLTDTVNNKTIIVKQAAEELRISKDIKLSTDRGRIEAEILKIQGEYAKGFVPKVYLYDEVMCVIVMEDMINHKMMRNSLLCHEMYPLFSDQISTFLVNTLINTSDLVMDHKKKKEMLKRFINPDLCDLTECLVYDEPYLNNNNRNNIDNELQQFVIKEIYTNNEVKLQAAIAKFHFMNNSQSLIHGDLHTGSIFINKEHLYVFDPEFAFFGPMGYDIGNIVANMFFAYVNGWYEIKDEKEKEEYCRWVMTTIVEIINMFKTKFHNACLEIGNDSLAKTKGFYEYYLSNILKDTARVTGLEITRRIVGLAGVSDIEGITDQENRLNAQKALLLFAKQCLVDHSEFISGSDYKNKFIDIFNQYK